NALAQAGSSIRCPHGPTHLARSSSVSSPRWLAGAGALLAVWAQLEACSNDVRVVDANAGSASSGGGGGVGNPGSTTVTSTSAASSGGGGGVPCTPAGTQCMDCIDNDGDGAIDAWDTECTGPIDNDEGSFMLAIPDLCETALCGLDC